MIEDCGPNNEEQIEAYLAGRLNASEREAFAQRLRTDPELQMKVELQQQIDASLRRLFPAAEPTEEQLSALSSELVVHRESIDRDMLPRVRTRRWWRVAAFGAAAAIAWLIVAWQFHDRGANEPFFEPQPLTHVYHETVDNGFEPYYECREPERFAATFAGRQGQPLALLPMPAGSGMLGLSYSGGLSRNTTAMLCRVDDQPVMVFVDRLSDDKPLATVNDDPALHVFRAEKHGLVFYEVTPFDQARVLDYLVPESESS